MLQPAGETPEQHTCLEGQSRGSGRLEYLRSVNILVVEFVNFLCISISGPRLFRPRGGTRACSGADWNETRSVMKPNFTAGTMLGSPNSLSLRQTEPRLTSQSPGEAAPKLPAQPQETQAERPRRKAEQRILDYCQKELDSVFVIA